MVNERSGLFYKRSGEQNSPTVLINIQNNGKVMQWIKKINK